MSDYKTLKVIDSTFNDLNALKIRIAVSSENRIPVLSRIVSALITVGNNHYDELLSELAKEPDSES